MTVSQLREAVLCWILASILGFVAIVVVLTHNYTTRADERTVNANRVLAEANRWKLNEQQEIIDEMAQQIVNLHWQLEDSAPFDDELARLAEDIDVCHARVDDAFWAREIVSRVEGPRARAPSTTERVRPK